MMWAAARRMLAAALPGLLWLAGCAAPRASDVPAASAGSARGVEPTPVSIHADPPAYLRRVHARCAELQQYTLTLIRQERRGLFMQLTPRERIAAWFRRAPLSVRFRWLDESVKYGESTYVAGWNADRVRFAPRHGFLGAAPPIINVSLQTPVTWGEARYPVTEFGVEKMMERTLRSIEESRGEARVVYLGVDAQGSAGAAAGAPPVHRFEIHYPSWYTNTTLQELRIDAATDLPLVTTLREADGTLDSSYEFQDLNPRVHLTDADFQLEIERKREQARAAAQP